MTYTALFLDREQKIRANVFPEKPVPRFYHDEQLQGHQWREDCDRYEAALQSALDTGIEVDDQEKAGHILRQAIANQFNYSEIESMKGHFPIPGYKMEVKEVPTNPEVDHTSYPTFKKLATLKPI